MASVLSHVIDGQERPITFISRSLADSEKKYSQLDRKALAIYWSIKKLHEYLFGFKFKLITDNKPLSAIFLPRKEVPHTSAARLLHYAIFLRAYNYEVVHENAKEHTNVDYSHKH